MHVGDEVVLIGEQGDERITADEWADRLGTISYEIVCGISARVPRRYLGTRRGRTRGHSVITDISGVRVGHWTHPEAQTGCTVILFPEGTRASGEVRGGAPATREFDLLAPERMVDRLDAVLLTGGSAFGLASADGVMRWCAEQGSGFATGAGPVPIVVTMALFDLLVGEPHVRPGAVEGYAACAEARGGAVQVGRIGAGTGATIGKWRGREHARPGGLGSATVRDGDLVVSALVAVNAVGDIDDGSEPDSAAAATRRLRCRSARGREHHDRRRRDERGARQGRMLRCVPRGARRDRAGVDALAHPRRWRRDRRWRRPGGSRRSSITSAS